MFLNFLNVYTLIKKEITKHGKMYKNNMQQDKINEFSLNICNAWLLICVGSFIIPLQNIPHKFKHSADIGME